MYILAGRRTSHLRGAKDLGSLIRPKTATMQVSLKSQRPTALQYVAEKDRCVAVCSAVAAPRRMEPQRGRRKASREPRRALTRRPGAEPTTTAPCGAIALRGRGRAGPKTGEM